MDAIKCASCKGPLPAKLPHNIRVCSTNCFNKLEWKFYRKQLLGGAGFGFLFIWAISGKGNTLGVAVASAITTAFIIFKIQDMRRYPWNDFDEKKSFLWVTGQVLLVSFFFAIGVICLFTLIDFGVVLIDNFDWFKFMSFVFIIPPCFFGIFIGFYNLPEAIREIKDGYKWRGKENVTPIPLERKKRGMKNENSSMV